MGVVGHCDFNENPVVSPDLDLGFVKKLVEFPLRGGGRPAQITDKADSKVGFLHFQAIIAKKLEVGEGLS